MTEQVTDLIEQIESTLLDKALMKDRGAFMQVGRSLLVDSVVLLGDIQSEQDQLAKARGELAEARHKIDSLLRQRDEARQQLEELRITFRAFKAQVQAINV